LGDAHGIINFQSAFEAIFKIGLGEYGNGFRQSISHRLDHLHRKLHPAFDGTSILIFAPVGSGA